jgi:hypothetical protein
MTCSERNMAIRNDDSSLIFFAYRVERPMTEAFLNRTFTQILGCFFLLLANKRDFYKDTHDVNLIFESCYKTFVFPHFNDTPEGAANVLLTDWEIASKEDLMHTLQMLLRTRTAFSAWNYCRLVNLAGIGNQAGFIEKEEAWKWIDATFIKVQREYKDWGTYMQDFIKGRNQWDPGDDLRPNFEDIVANMLKYPNSIYQLIPLIDKDTVIVKVASKYYTFREDVSREDFPFWGGCHWYVEVDGQDYITRQIEAYDNGSYLKYDEHEDEDAHGQMNPYPFYDWEYQNSSEITKEEFEGKWGQAKKLLF